MKLRCFYLYLHQVLFDFMHNAGQSVNCLIFSASNVFGDVFSVKLSIFDVHIGPFRQLSFRFCAINSNLAVLSLVTIFTTGEVSRLFGTH